MAAPDQQKTISELASLPDTYGTTMLAIAVKVLGTDFLPMASADGWDPETIMMELTGALRTPVHPSAFNRLMAAVQVVTSDFMFKSLPDFVQIVNGLAAGTPPGIVALPDAFDVTWGITEGLILWPPDDKEQEPFIEEIVDYIGAVLKREGIMSPPDVLRLGLRADGNDLLDKIHAEFSDDPTMFNAVFDMEKNKTREIEEDLRYNLRRLMEQLSSVDGTAFKDAAGGLLQALDAQEAGSDQLKPI